ncbi:MAG: hypothetical protein KF810_02760 [Rhizobiaceae bacterium]|nr:hypothetical protein [Rhizobiaceae bacterium]
MTLWHENLQRLVPIVEEKLASAHAVVGDMNGDYHGWKQRLNVAEAALVEHFTDQENAWFRESSSGHSVRMAGIKASSTISVASALRNWRTAAQLKLLPEPAQDDVINLQGSGPAPIEARDAP